MKTYLILWTFMMVLLTSCSSDVNKDAKKAASNQCEAARIDKQLIMVFNAKKKKELKDKKSAFLSESTKLRRRHDKGSDSKKFNEIYYQEIAACK